MKLYRCKICGKIIAVLEDGSPDTICCGEVMDELCPMQSELRSQEKHIPTYTRFGDDLWIRVGEILHPSTENHRINWILIEFYDGYLIRYLDLYEVPEICIKIERSKKIKAIYAYCNIHGLWIKKLE